jgi:hypothetical protein
MLALFRDSRPFNSTSSKNYDAVLFFAAIGDEVNGEFIAK